MKFNWHTDIFNLPRPVKRLMMVSADFVSVSFALWTAYALRFSALWPEPYISSAEYLFLFAPIMGIIIFYVFGLYRAVVRHLNIELLFLVLLGVFVLMVSLYAFASLVPTILLPRSVPLIFGLSCGLFIGGSRLAFRSYYHWWLHLQHKDKNALIYGAGGAGIQLVAALQASGEIAPVGFVDDGPNLQGSVLAGLRIHPTDELDRVVADKNVTMILLAIANISAPRRKVILERLAKLPVTVKTMPSLPEIIDGKAVDELRQVDIMDLLGRDMIDPHDELISASIKGKSVCITGAGGSIGSELARQAVSNGASTVILYEMSEAALYNIDRELGVMALNISSSVRIIPVLGSVLDEQRMEAILHRFGVNTMFHAAAYKHVPLVEQNVLQGLSNNTIGTLRAARAAQKMNIERFVLISTDKAVRPTNIMGATKRFAEICVQYLARSPRSKTIFSMVRFGNVLGSSGSVVPLFREQIAKGGPVTVTHPHINRYFMTISEAASLVIQAGAMANGNEVFVLDMGEPVKIVQLAENMINLQGLQVKSPVNPNGDIEILYSGLRPGEKLYEELLIGDDVIPTRHPKILCAHELSLDDGLLTDLLDKVDVAVETNDSEAARDILKRAVVEFTPSSNDIDWLKSYDKLAGDKVH